MGWKIIYYTSPSGRNPVSEFIDACSTSQQVKILRVLKYLQEYGIQPTIPSVKKLSGTPFWEIRVLGKDSIRIIYVAEINRTIILLNGFFKKTNKTPRREIDICYRRHQEIKRLLTS